MTHSIIKTLREKNDVSLEELSKVLDTSRPTLSKIEKGEGELTTSQIKKASQFFNVSFEALIENKLKDDIGFNVIPSQKRKSSEDEKVRIDITEENLNKFKEVLLYILKKVGAKPNIGQTVIYKLLYFIDFDFYEKHEKQLMGNIYIKNTFGPTPITFTKAVNDMCKNKELEVVKSRYFGKDQTKYLPVRKANIELLNAEEIKHIDNILGKLSNLSASEISEYSHKDVPWITTEDGKPIPYESVFYRTPETSVRRYEE